MPETRRILLVDEDRTLRERASAALAEEGFELLAVSEPGNAVDALRRRPVELAIVDLDAPAPGGLALLRSIRSGASPRPQLPVIGVAREARLAAAAEAGRLGTSDIVSLREEGVEDLLARARALLARAEPALPDELVGPSRSARALRTRIAALAELEVPVLLRGAPHTGHHAVAAHLHAASARAAHPLVVREAGESAEPLPLAGPGTLHVAGAERLSPAEQQALRAELRRGATNGAREERVRLVVSAGAELRSAVEAKRLDAELAERLARFPLHLPSLRERRADLPELAERLLRRAAARLGRPPPELSPAAADRLARHPWPENLRSLARVAELLAALAPSGSISPDAVEAALAEVEGPLERIVRERERDERRLLLELYARHGTYTGVARELGLTRNAAKYRFAKHGLIPDRRVP